MKELERFLFRPSSRVRAMTLFGLNPTEDLELYNIVSPKGDLSAFLAGVVQSVARFYQFDCFGEDMKYAERKIGRVVGVAVNNALVHGTNGREPVLFGLFGGEGGICYGFYDGGDYFKSKEIKRQWEAKEELKRFSRPVGQRGNLMLGSGMNVGVNQILFPYSDMIEVDCKRGILYCVQKKESLTVPIN